MIQWLSTSINNRYVRGTFFDEKYSPKEKKLFRKEVIKYPYQIDKNNKGKVI